MVRGVFGELGFHDRVGGQVSDSKADGAITAGVRPGVDASNCLDCGARRVDDQLGLEPNPEEYVARLVVILREARRVLRLDGTLWLNLGDCYTSGGRDYRAPDSKGGDSGAARGMDVRPDTPAGLKPKDLVGIPWMVAFALRADGWYLRQENIWNKLNPMPESVLDRPTRAHETVFLLSKSRRYYYDAEAVKEPDGGKPSGNGFERPERISMEGRGSPEPWLPGGGRNKRSVWTIPTRPFGEAHFATFPPDLVIPCVLAGTPPKTCAQCGAPWRRMLEATGEMIQQANGPGTIKAHRESKGKHGATSVFETGFKAERRTVGWEATCDHDDESGRPVVLDPFCGAATTGLVATQQGRNFIGIELNEDYAELGRDRIRRWEADPAGALGPAPKQAEGQIGMEMGEV